MNRTLIAKKVALAGTGRGVYTTTMRGSAPIYQTMEQKVGFPGQL